MAEPTCQNLSFQHQRSRLPFQQDKMKTVERDEQAVGLDEAGSILGVCSATVRNWIRHELLNAKTANGKLFFSPEQLLDLKSQISSGRINRLNRRANKKESGKTFVPSEYAESARVISAIDSVLQLGRGLRCQETLFAIVLNVLERQGLVSINGQRYQAKTKTLRAELNWWEQNTPNFQLGRVKPLISAELPEGHDFPGLMYQALSRAGDKSRSGSYYTPRNIVAGMVNDHVYPNSLVLDPCCGTGQFLIAAAAKVERPENLWGFDSDETATRLARINLICLFAEREFTPHVYAKNTLLDLANPPDQFLDLFNPRKGHDEIELPQFDVVLTNPPWGSHFKTSEVERFGLLYPQLRSNEAFSLFLLKSVNLLKRHGSLSFILPEAFLNIKVHADIRSFLLKETQIKRIVHLGRVFQNVFTPVIRLDLQKIKPTPEASFAAVNGTDQKDVRQARLGENTDYIFDLFTGEDDLAIFQAVYKTNHVTLAGRADWALGVVTGDNSKYLSQIPAANYEPILTGKDLKKFTAEPAKKFIHFEPEKFQQVAPVHKYRSSEKLIYKFISSELVFVYDDQQTLSLNSANILIPALPGFPVKSVLAFLNSSLFQFIFQKKFGAFKVLRGNLEKLPFPVLSVPAHERVVSFVNILLNAQASGDYRREAFWALDDYIMELFGLSVSQKDYVRSNVKISAKSLPY